MRLRTGSILGTFSKGIENSVSINFGVSGGANCETSCQHHPVNDGACYAVRAEIRPDRQELTNKLVRHEAMPAALVCGKALYELQSLVIKGKIIPWVRFSTNGSLPKPDDVRENKLFVSQFRKLVEFCVKNGIPVHIPVESHKKARFYRSLIGDLVTIRESVQNVKRFPTAAGQVSIAIGHGLPLRNRVSAAATLAKSRTNKTGRKTVVCPAVVSSFNYKLNSRGLTAEEKSKLKLRYSKAKCGACVACASADVDVVYPIH